MIQIWLEMTCLIVCEKNEISECYSVHYVATFFSKLNLEVKKSDFQKSSKIHSKHVRLSKAMFRFRGAESSLGPYRIHLNPF